ncbi:hypothetical protein SK128_001319 [Halocaridina rubra]|uniref:C2H2-type domain-containing protein n=1 Tax=Halocaridina rubra TaxID=373956 RepID=A0AAN8XSB6_HALRR
MKFEDRDGHWPGWRGSGAPRESYSTTTPITNVKSRQCPYCNYSTNVTTNMRNHLRTHTGETPFSCTFCSYSTTTKQSLIYHIRTHTGEKPFACPHCPYRSKQQGTMKCHIATHSKSKSSSVMSLDKQDKEGFTTDN